MVDFGVLVRFLSKLLYVYIHTHIYISICNYNMYTCHYILYSIIHNYYVACVYMCIL